MKINNALLESKNDRSLFTHKLDEIIIWNERGQIEWIACKCDVYLWLCLHAVEYLDNFKNFTLVVPVTGVEILKNNMTKTLGDNQLDIGLKQLVQTGWCGDKELTSVVEFQLRTKINSQKDTLERWDSLNASPQFSGHQRCHWLELHSRDRLACP